MADRTDVRRSTRPPVDDTNQGQREEGRLTATAVAARSLTVLVLVMVITSIVGFIVFDRQGGNSAAAVASLAIGGASAILGLLLGFLKAYDTG